METTYTHETGARRSGRTGARRTSGQRGRRRAVSLAPRERRRLAQLCVCAALFALAFFGRGILPVRGGTAYADLLHVLRADTDFRAAFASLGRSISAGEPVTETLGGLCADVFLPDRRTPVPAGPLPENIPTYDAERAFLASQPTGAEVFGHRFGRSGAETPEVEAGNTAAEAPATPITEIVPEPAPVPSGTLPAQPRPVYTGPAMPDGATMDELTLGLEGTVSPVVAAVASGYGWREHPIEGGEKFHSGVDLAADYGSAIGAFADGTVDYIGESPAYGEYLQIRHANGVTTFYAHCSKLCVQQGQAVTQGETVAEVGDTGNVTGAHLHFELKQGGTFLNPLYYIQTLNQ